MLISKITWNFPVGIDLGFYTIHFYSLMFVIAFSLGYYLMGKIYEREGRSKDDLESVFMYAVIATIVGARLGQVLFYQWDYFQHNLLEIFLPVKFKPEFKFTGFQGLASHGAAIGFVVAMYFYSKKINKNTLWSLDRVTIPAAFGGIFVRIGNFFNSEIIGKATDAFTGVRFIKSDISEYQAVKVTGIKRGFMFGTYMLLIFFVRFLVENVKESQGGWFEELFGVFSTGQWLSIPFMIVGVYFMFTSKNKTA